MIREAEFTTAGQHIRWKARDLTFDHIPVISIDFTDFCELLSILRAGPSKYDPIRYSTLGIFCNS